MFISVYTNWTGVIFSACRTKFSSEYCANPTMVPIYEIYTLMAAIEQRTRVIRWLQCKQLSACASRQSTSTHWEACMWMSECIWLLFRPENIILEMDWWRDHLWKQIYAYMIAHAMHKEHFQNICATRPFPNYWFAWQSYITKRFCILQLTQVQTVE